MSDTTANPAGVLVNTPAPAYHWALLERELLRAQTQACQEFFNKYFDERGYLECVVRWGGDDGPDDAAENLLNWTMLHALGAPDVMLEMYKKGWEGHLRQYTEARTVEVPMAREGMYYKEFPVWFDWFHHGEWLSAFTLQGLSDPTDPNLIRRMRRYAGLYMGENPQAPNYDAEHKVIRSMFSGSRGPMLRKATGLDWAGDPIEIEGRFRLGHGEQSYEQIVAHFKDYNDVAGDHMLNLATTTQAFNAYMLTGEAKYKQWMLDYVDAWVERTRANDGIIPSNIGLDGTIGGAADGKWYGGVYGWGFSVIVPQTGELAHRPYYDRVPYGFGNALLMTGDPRYIDIWRQVIDKVNTYGKMVDGRMMYPRSFGDQGWYNFRPTPFDAGALEVYYWSMDPADLKRVPREDRSDRGTGGFPEHPWFEHMRQERRLSNGWVAYLQGERTAYPEEALTYDLGAVRQKIAWMREDMTSPDTRLSDDMNHINPATTDALIRLMLGGLPTGRAGYPLHCRVRYFDPARRRAGIPEDVAALVEKMTADETVLNLVNINQVEERTVIIQGGAYAEHQIESVTLGDQTVAVDRSSFPVRLAPGCGARLTLKMKRYVNQPTLAFPWA